MIKTITFNTTKPQKPSTGDVYYDSTKNRNYIFDGGRWKELITTGKNKERLRKIKNIF